MKRKWTHLSERRNGNYRYVRDFPTKLLKAIPSHPKQFCKEPGLATPALTASFTEQWIQLLRHPLIYTVRRCRY